MQPTPQHVLDPDIAHSIRRVLSTILRKTNAVNGEVAMISDLLDGLDVTPPLPLGSANGQSRFGGSVGVPASTKSLGMPKRYEVREISGEQRLLEYREGSDAPFAVPRSFYDAFVETTADYSGKHFDQIFRKHPDEDKKDYLGRVLFRFWQSKGLLTNQKGRYLITPSPEAFKQLATKAWEELL